MLKPPTDGVIELLPLYYRYPYFKQRGEGKEKKMSIHENNKVSMNEIEMSLEKNIYDVNERERVLESCKEEIEKHQNPLKMLQDRGYREVVSDAISLANGTINIGSFVNRITANNSLITIEFLSVTQARYQFKKVIGAINAEINRFKGRECIIHGYCSPHDEQLILGPINDEPISENINDYQAVEVYTEFINTKKGRVQLERLREAIDAELDKFEEKGLIGRYNSNNKGSESDLTREYTNEEIQNFEKEHKVQIERY